MDYPNKPDELAKEFQNMPKYTLNVKVKQRMLGELKRYQESVGSVPSQSKRSGVPGSLAAGAAAIAACGMLWGYIHQSQAHQQTHPTTTADNNTGVQVAKYPFVVPKSQWVLPGYKVEYERVSTGWGNASFYFEEVKNQRNMYGVTEIKTPSNLKQFLQTTGMFTKATFPWGMIRPFTYDGIEIGRDISRVGDRGVNYEFVDGAITYAVVATGGNNHLDLRVIDSLLHHTGPMPNDIPVIHEKTFSLNPSTNVSKSH